MTTRRHVLIALGACVLTLGLPIHAFRPAAAATQDVDVFIRTLGDEALRMLDDPTLDREQRESKFRAILQRGFDLDTIGRFVLGRHWRQASEAQRAEYRMLFEDFIVKSYSARFSQYSGETFDIKDVRQAEADDTLVQTQILRPSGPPVRVDWRVRRHPEQLKIVDITVEGVSMAITQRQEFSAVIQGGGGDLEILLAKLRQKIAESR